MCGLLAWTGCAFSPSPGGMAGEDPMGPDSAVPDPDAGVEVDADLATARCQAAIGAMSFDWEGDAQGWDHGPMPAVAGEGNYWRWEHWERGQVSSGPGACRSGSGGCWATNLEDNYISCQRGYLVSPALDLGECQGVDIKLVFYHWYDFWSGEVRSKSWHDGGLVEFSSDGVNWAPTTTSSYVGDIEINPSINSNRCVFENDFHVHEKPGFIGDSQGWQRVEIAIPEEFRAGGFQVRFVYGSGVSYATYSQTEAMRHTRPGWYLDDLAVEVGSAL